MAIETTLSIRDDYSATLDDLERRLDRINARTGGAGAGGGSGGAVGAISGSEGLGLGSTAAAQAGGNFLSATAAHGVGGSIAAGASFRALQADLRRSVNFERVTFAGQGAGRSSSSDEAMRERQQRIFGGPNARMYNPRGGSTAMTPEQRRRVYGAQDSSEAQTRRLVGSPMVKETLTESTQLQLKAVEANKEREKSEEEVYKASDKTKEATQELGEQVKNTGVAQGKAAEQTGLFSRGLGLLTAPVAAAIAGIAGIGGLTVGFKALFAAGVKARDQNADLARSFLGIRSSTEAARRSADTLRTSIGPTAAQAVVGLDTVEQNIFARLDELSQQEIAATARGLSAVTQEAIPLETAISHLTALKTSGFLDPEFLRLLSDELYGTSDYAETLDLLGLSAATASGHAGDAGGVFEALNKEIGNQIPLLSKTEQELLKNSDAWKNFFEDVGGGFQTFFDDIASGFVALPSLFEEGPDPNSPAAKIGRFFTETVPGWLGGLFGGGNNEPEIDLSDPKYQVVDGWAARYMQDQARRPLSQSQWLNQIYRPQFSASEFAGLSAGDIASDYRSYRNQIELTIKTERGVEAYVDGQVPNGGVFASNQGQRYVIN